jgi:hypothetical protein
MEGMFVVSFFVLRKASCPSNVLIPHFNTFSGSGCDFAPNEKAEAHALLPKHLTPSVIPCRLRWQPQRGISVLRRRKEEAGSMK